MRKTIVVLAALSLFLICSCSSLYIRADEAAARRYSSAEILLSDFSKKVTAYYERQGLQIPKDFDGKQFIEVLEKVYPDQSKVESIKNSFIIEARPIDSGYSVMLCDPKTGSKIMEDFSCNLSRVEMRDWDKEDAFPCKFEENWKPYCN